MGRFYGHRIPDNYNPNWDNGTNVGDYYDWWHLGYESGEFNTKWDYGISDNPSTEDTKPVETYSEKIKRLEETIESIQMNVDANLRIARQEIEKQVRAEASKSTKEIGS